MTGSNSESGRGLYLQLISVHGLIRGEDLELGRDSDTGGQTLYVVELARALSRHPDVDRVDLITRRIEDNKVDSIYRQSIEPIAERANIVRIPCGPRRYLRKEKLWPYLDSFTDHILYHIRMVGRVPDVVHGHYADAGYAGAHLASLLGVPFVFTGHSLGRVKRARLLDGGAKEAAIDSTFHFEERIEAEETALATAALVVASTHQEVDDQYAAYDHYDPSRMEVIPPGVDLDRFSPPGTEMAEPPMLEQLRRFLREPDKPMILALARPDERKNFPTLIEAYGSNPELRERANLVLATGTREHILDMDAGSRRVLSGMLMQIDRYDLYGRVAYPKNVTPDDVPGLYRIAADRRGVFVNPALTEPFGLTLIEAAASGLPIVATNDGGPRDIVSECHNGLLVDPLDAGDLAAKISEVLDDSAAWDERSRAGIEGAHRHFSWPSHVGRYLGEIGRIRAGERFGAELLADKPSRLPTIDRLLVTDIDDTLTGDTEGLDALVARLKQGDHRWGLGIATGRNLERALEVIEELGVPMPDLLITSVGADISYGTKLTPDRSWHKHIDYQWDPERVAEAMAELPGIEPQPPEQQAKFKLSYFIDTEVTAPREVVRHLRQKKLRVNSVFSFQAYVDLLPIRASSGLAIRYLALKWGLPPERILVAGDSGNDEDMLTGNTLGVVVGNYSPELEPLRGKPRIYFAEASHSWGVLEGIDHYNFFDSRIPIPEEEEEVA